MIERDETEQILTASFQLGVVVVNYNSPDLLAENLVRTARESDTAVVVVDNSDDLVQKAAADELCKKHSWIYLDAGGNQGFGRGANLGAARAVELGCSELLFLNPDAWIDAPNLAVLREYRRQHPQAMVSPRILFPDGKVWFSGATLRMVAGMAVHNTSIGPAESEWLTAACLLTGAGTWQDLEGFDEAYFLYWEDVDFTHRWKAKGGDLLVTTASTAFHSVGGTQTTGHGKSMTYVYYNSKNRLRFAAKSGHGARLFLWTLTEPCHAYWMARMAWARWETVRPIGWAIARGVVGGIAAGLGLLLRAGPT